MAMPRSRLILVVLVVAASLGGVYRLVSAGSAPASPTTFRAGKAAPARHAVLRRISFAVVGDMAMVANDDGGASFFAGVTPYLHGDVVLGNLEGTLTDRGSSKCGSGSSSCFAFRAPPSYGSLLKRAGFTVVNTANNHAYDFGSVGQADTLATLDRLGVRHSGRPGEIAVLRVGSARVAVLGFAPYPWAQSLTDIPAAQALVRRAAREADLVVVMIHAGAEGADASHVRPGSEFYLGENRGDSEAFAHAVIRAGADLVVGSGPHVLRGMEWYRGRLAAYSLGNFEGCHTLSTGRDLSLSGVLHVTLRSDGSWIGGDLVPIHLVGCGVPERDPAEASHGFVRERSKEDFGSRAVRISYKGVLSPPG
jgi:Bacterial capsule synthesis protein PGA_cap